MMKTKRVKLENLVPDNPNANRGTARGAGMVEHSIRNYGAGRSDTGGRAESNHSREQDARRPVGGRATRRGGGLRPMALSWW